MGITLSSAGFYDGVVDASVDYKHSSFFLSKGELELLAYESDGVFIDIFSGVSGAGGRFVRCSLSNLIGVSSVFEGCTIGLGNRISSRTENRSSFHRCSVISSASNSSNEFRNCVFTECFDLRGTFEDCEFIDCKIVGGIFKGCKFSGSSLGACSSIGGHFFDCGFERFVGSSGTFEDCAFRGGMLGLCHFFGSKSKWYRGIFHGGRFEDSLWEHGEFKGGSFVGGTFEGGTVTGGIFRGVDFTGGKFKGNNSSSFSDGTFKAEEFSGGEFIGGKFLGGKVTGGLFRDVDFVSGTWESNFNSAFIGGTFGGSKFVGGTFKGGTFKGDIFKDGRFIDGNWVSGDWQGGYDGEGDWREPGNSPLEWASYNISSIANEAGVYNDFTGIIDYHGTFCNVKNASFELLSASYKYKRHSTIWLEFSGGRFYDGKVVGAKLVNCHFRDVDLTWCIFNGGNFGHGRFNLSYWIDGTWWGGDWSHSFDKFGRLRSLPPSEWDSVITGKGVANSEGIYEDFSGTVNWKESSFEVKDAEFELVDRERNTVVFHDGSVVGGVLKDAVCWYCIFKDGEFQGRSWRDGVFSGGKFTGGSFNGGRFVGGQFLGGDWNGGLDKYGNYHGEDDSPDKWDL